MGRSLNRRGFLRSAALSGASLVVLRDAASAGTAQANQRLNIAHVGAGGRGRELIGSFSRAENIVALCDVNGERSAEVYKTFPAVPKFQDFRVMLDEMGREIDAVVVATPDHTHAVASVAAMRAGKPVYCEKPLTRLVSEARALRELARTRRLATQMGNQGTSAGPFRRGVELIRGGVLGTIQEMHVWNDQGGPGHRQPPEGTPRIPFYLRWDLWLGPAQDRPFHPRWMAWSGWRDFGTNQLGNWASHTANLGFMALRVDSLWHVAPTVQPRPVLRVEAQVAEANRLSFPRWEEIRWDIPARGDLPPVAFHWHNGSSAPGMRQRIEEMMGRRLDWGDAGERRWADFAGALIVGTKGKLHATGHNATTTLLPADQFQGVQKDRPETLPQSPGHEREWLNACRGGPAALSNFDYSGPLTEFLMLGNVASQFPGPLEFDPVEGRITNQPEADAALRHVYREGWSV